MSEDGVYWKEVATRLQDEWRMKYAGMALQGLLAAGGVTMGQGDTNCHNPAARAAFAYADAMLAEAEKERP